MTKHVYVVEQIDEEAYSCIIGIYSTRELAQECFDGCLNNSEDDYSHWSIFKFDLDDVSLPAAHRTLVVTTFNGKSDE